MKEKTSIGEAIQSTEMAIRILGEMANAYGNKPKGEPYRAGAQDLKVVSSILKGYREDLEKGKPAGPARSALTEACQIAARDLLKINSGLSAAYETLPDRIDEGPRYRQKGESAFGAPEIIIWLIAFAIVYGILRNANIF